MMTKLKSQYDIVMENRFFRRPRV